MKIRIASLILAIALVIPMVTSSFADGGVELVQVTQEIVEPDALFYLDGEPLDGVAAQSIDGTYYVALNSMMSLLDPNAVVEETPERVTVSAQATVVHEGDPQDGTEATLEVLDTLQMTVDAEQRYLVANGRYLYLPDGCQRVDGMIAIPVRILAKILNMTVYYDAQSGTVQLSSPAWPGYLADGSEYYNEESIYWLSRIIYCESGNQRLSGKIAVGNVVMNRVNDPQFPNSIYEVIFQKNQFTPASTKAIYRTPNEESVIAAKLVLDGALALDDVLFFNRAGMNSYASRNRTYVATIGEHAFYA